MRQIMSYSSTTFHQLNLFFINADNGTIGIGCTFHSDNKTVGQ